MCTQLFSPTSVNSEKKVDFRFTLQLGATSKLISGTIVEVSSIPSYSRTEEKVLRFTLSYKIKII